MKKALPILLLLLLLVAGWLALPGRGGGDPVARLVADMVPIPGKDYLMGKYEVTQAQWEAVTGENPSHYKGADHPVERVSWDDCQAFLETLNAHPAARASGLVFRLPTEKEWEFACRAGSTNVFCRLADGTEITEATLGRVAWYNENASTRPRWLSHFLDFAESIVDRVHEVDWSETTSHRPVGRKEPNSWGLYDMHGNVMEWTDTAIGDTAIGKIRFVLGGCWFLPARSCMSHFRDWDSPSRRYRSLGFRLCATQRPSAEEPPAEASE